jgi:hypothetical protein
MKTSKEIEALGQFFAFATIYKEERREEISEKEREIISQRQVMESS